MRFIIIFYHGLFREIIDSNDFFETVNEFESLLVGSGIQIIKYYLDISKQEQALRLQ